MLALFRTLSPQQLSPEQIRMMNEVGAAEPQPIEHPNYADVLMPTGGTFYATMPAMPTTIEVRVLSALLLLRFEEPREDKHTIEEWLRGVETDATRIAELGGKWSPKSVGIWHPKQHIQLEVEEALRVDIMASNGNGEIETVAAVVGVSASDIYAYVHRLRMRQGQSGKLFGPIRDNKNNKSPRQVSAIPAIAALLSGVERRQLRISIANRRVRVERSVKKSKAELLEDMEVVVEELKEKHAGEVESLEAEVESLEAKVVDEQAKKLAAQKLKSHRPRRRPRSRARERPRRRRARRAIQSASAVS